MIGGESAPGFITVSPHDRTAMTAAIAIEALTKRFGRMVAVDGLVELGSR